VVSTCLLQRWLVTLIVSAVITDWATLAPAATLYWDTNGTVAGSGAATGTWGTSTFWSTTADGTGTTSGTLPTNVDDVFFAAGNNGTAGTITISGAKTANSLTFDDNVALVLSGGTSLTLGGGGAPNSGIYVAAGDDANNSLSTPVALGATATTLQTAGAGVLTISGAISGTSNITLNNNSTNAAGITLGTGAFNITGTLTNSGTGTGGVLITAAIGANVTGVIQDSTTSAMTLRGANVYTATTTVSRGTLIGGQLSGTPFGTGNVVLNGGTLQLAPAVSGTRALAGVNASVGSTFTYGAGSTLQLSVNGTSLSYTIGHASAAADSVLVRSGRGTLVLGVTALSNLSTIERLLVNGQTTASNKNGAASATGIFDATMVAQQGTGDTGSFVAADTVANGGFKLATYTTRAAGALFPVNEISDVTASISATDGSNPYALRVGAVTLANAGTTTVNGGAASATNSGLGGVIFNPTTTKALITGGTVAFGSSEGVVYVGSGTGTGEIASNITGTAGLTKFGPGRLTIRLTASSTLSGLSGGMTVNSGTLAVATTGGVQTVSLANTVAMADGTTFLTDSAGGSTAISNGFDLTSGRVTFVANNGISGANGDLELFGQISGNGTMIVTGQNNANRRRIELKGTNSFTGGTVMKMTDTTTRFRLVAWNSSSLGTGNLRVETTELGGALESGSVALGIGTGIANNIEVIAGATLSTASQANTGCNLLLSGIISGAGGLSVTTNNQNGISTIPQLTNYQQQVILSGANTYTGITTVKQGVLRLTRPAALYNGNTANWTAANIIVNGGTILNGQHLATLAVNYGGTGEFSATDVNTLLTNLLVSNANGLKTGSAIGFDTSNAVAPVSYLNIIPDSSGTSGGTIGLTKLGTGTLILNAANTFSGQTTVSSGILNVQHNSALGTTVNGTTVNSGAVLQLQGSLTIPAEPLTLSGTGISNSGALQNVSGNNDFGGQLSLNAATRINSDSGTLTFSNGGAVLGFTNPVTFGGAGNITFAGVVSATVASLTKDGTGVLNLTAANLYTGGTTVNGGTLLVNNSTDSATGTGAVNVNATGVLGGGNLTNTLGKIVGNVNISGGTLAPGNVDAAGVLSITGNLTLNTSATSAFDLLNSTDYDAVRNVATMTFGGTLTVSNLGIGPTYANGQVYDLFDWTGGASGTFSTINLPTLLSGLRWKSFGAQQFDYTTGQIVVEAGANQWAVDGSGAWATGTNWTTGTAPPNDNTGVSRFYGIATNAVSIDIAGGDRTVKQLLISNANAGASYTFTSTGFSGERLIFAADSGNALIEFETGNTNDHTIETDVRLNSATNLKANANTLTIGSPLHESKFDWNGKTLTVETGKLKFSRASGLNPGGATLAINSGATVELAGSASGTSAGSVGVSVTNNGTLSITGTSQVVGAITGTGATVLEQFTDLTATRIKQGSLAFNSVISFDTAKVTLQISSPAPTGNNSLVNHLGTLTIPNDGSVRSAPYLAKTYYATLDLTNNDLIIDNATLADVEDLVRSGANSTISPDWTGHGITSSYVPMQTGTTLGVIRNVANPKLASGPALYSLFDGETLVGNEILVKYTWNGDFDLDGKVTSFDYALLDAGFAGTTQIGGQAGWFFGDANLDGTVDTFDYSLLQSGYSAYISSGSNPLPEPSALSLGIIALGVAGASRWLRRRR